MTPDTYGNIHVVVSLTILLLLEGMSLWGLWKIIGNFRLWILIAAIVLFVVAYVWHRWIPKATGPFVEGEIVY